MGQFATSQVQHRKESGGEMGHRGGLWLGIAAIAFAPLSVGLWFLYATAHPPGPWPGIPPSALDALHLASAIAALGGLLLSVAALVKLQTRPLIGMIAFVANIAALINSWSFV